MIAPPFGCGCSLPQSKFQFIAQTNLFLLIRRGDIDRNHPNLLRKEVIEMAKMKGPAFQCIFTNNIDILIVKGYI